jgi:hypothetical protein
MKLCPLFVGTTNLLILTDITRRNRISVPKYIAGNKVILFSRIEIRSCLWSSFHLHCICWSLSQIITKKINSANKCKLCHFEVYLHTSSPTYLFIILTNQLCVSKIYRFVTIVYEYNYHTSGHYPSSCLLFKTQFNSIGLSVPHMKHITSPQRAQ